MLYQQGHLKFQHFLGYLDDLHINNTLREKLLAITFDCKLKFNRHIEDICHISQKLNAFARLAPYMKTTKKRILMNAFFKLQINYCPLVWMCCNRSLNTKINRLHERCLRIVYNNKKSSFNEQLVKDGSVSIHHQNLRKLAVEIFNVSRGLSPEIVNKLFQFREQIPYELRQRPQFQIPRVHSVFSGTESL